ncbi:hypothetical protein Rsub_01164 [Raphidocelis subcapitata]|uniref:RING-type domain-containing protein n=1 Tax=Raphidocelis subcapitata TaxID=307507 RepID=A0A2V0NLY0_9CHLO|nr:hypothetical protein Rsub_01164 [Raphidocelis subcapitata]|eukprot:GBF88451.1 hypothetical protein Rsub_01164 [Raphidocelis subcapitata]
MATAARQQAAASKAERSHSAAVNAAALQDDLCRRFAQVHWLSPAPLPGAPRTLPSLTPGAPLSLAQRCGLAPRPPPLLTDDEWRAVRARYLERELANEPGSCRGGSPGTADAVRPAPDACCPICWEPFREGPQLLLSCSHSFHEVCLAAWAHSRGGGSDAVAATATHSCPLCRAAHYQARRIADAADAWRALCIVRIQAAARGWLARRQFDRLLSAAPRPSEPPARRRWLAARLRVASAKALLARTSAACAAGGPTQRAVDALFAELEASAAASRRVLEEAATPRRRAPIDAAARPSGRVAQAAPAKAAPAKPPWCGALAAAAAAAKAPVGEAGRGGRPQQRRRRGPPGDALAAARAGAAAALAAADVRLRLHAQLGLSAPPLAAAASPFEEADGSFEPTGPSSSSRIGRGGTGGDGGIGGDSNDDGDDGPPGAPAVSVVDWPAAVARACERGEAECPVCLGPLAAPEAGGRGIALLSCSHALHEACIASLEAFQAAEACAAADAPGAMPGGAPCAARRCPVCRAKYVRRCFAVEPRRAAAAAETAAGGVPLA